MTLQVASSPSLFQNKPASCWPGLSPAAGKVCASAAEAPVLERAYTKNYSHERGIITALVSYPGK